MRCARDVVDVLLWLYMTSQWLLMQSAVYCREYCQFEYFNATCTNKQLVMMDHAQYGRLQVGRCVNKDYGSLGCSNSVLETLDGSCTGRSSCNVSVPFLRQLVQPCPKDLTSYLDADYHCISVVDPASTRCGTTVDLDGSRAVHVTGHVDAARPDEAIAAYSRSCPLHVAARPGQTINITLYSFARRHGTVTDVAPVPHDEESVVTMATAGSGSGTGGRDGVRHQRFCAGHVFISEGDRSIGGPLCPGQQRDRNLYQSRGQRVTIHFSVQQRSATGTPSSNTTPKRDLFFILRIAATGCADTIDPPRHGTWLERFDERLLVRCNRSHETWHLTCRDSKWIGTIGNCSETEESYNLPWWSSSRVLTSTDPMKGLFSSEKTEKSLIVASGRERLPTKYQVKVHFGLTVAVVGGVVLGVFAGLTMLITVFFHRQQRRRHQFSRMTGCRDRFNPKPTVEWPLVTGNDASSCLGDGTGDDVMGYGRSGKTTVYYDCAGDVQCSYQGCHSGEVDRSWYGTSTAASTVSAAEPGIAVESTAMISNRDITYGDLDSGYCCCRGMHQPATCTSRRCCIPVTVNYRRMMIDAQTDKNDGRSKRTRFVSSVSTDIELSPIVQRDKPIDRLLAVGIRPSTSSSVDPSPAGTLSGTDPHMRRSDAANRRPSVLRLTTFRPRTPSNGTASTSELDDGVFEGEEGSARFNVDNLRPEVHEMNSERRLYQQSNEEQIELIDKRLQPDLLPLVMGVMVTNGRSTSRVVAQLGGQAVDELL